MAVEATTPAGIKESVLNPVRTIVSSNTPALILRKLSVTQIQ